MDAQRLVIGGPGRTALGVACAALAGALIALGLRLDWGVAWTAFVPAGTLLLLAITLVRRTVLRADDGWLDIERGWFYRRALRLRLDADSVLEAVPTAGLRAVILHRKGREHVLATWLTAERAEALLVWIDAAAPTPLPRTQRPPPAGDV